MGSCSLSWCDKNKAQEIHVLGPWCCNDLSQDLESTFNITRIRKVEFCSCYLHTLVSLTLPSCFLKIHCYNWYQDSRNSFLSALKGPFYYYYYCYCCSLVLQRGKEVGLTDGVGWGDDSNKRVWLGGRGALGLRWERVIQDVTKENNVINMQSIWNWASSSRNATTAKLQLQHFLST